MLTHFIRNTISKQTVKYGFAQATTATDYYRLLGVSKGATTL